MATSVFAQDPIAIKGFVRGESSGSRLQPLKSATVVAIPGNKGTLTDSVGFFSMVVPVEAEIIEVRYPGFKPDTLALAENVLLQAVLVPLVQEDLNFRGDSVLIESQKESTTVNPFAPQLAENLGKDELLKAACCNLGESFETNAAVDVHFEDALTGTRQIQLLGLSGPYTQMTLESMPGIRGLSTGIGLDLIPGPWIESIQIARGAGSVANGYESIAGQINIEMVKPESGNRLYVNGYGNLTGRTELNINTSHKLGKKVGTSLLVHGSARPNQVDRNNDSFLDMPQTQQLNVLNRWYFSNLKDWRGQVGAQLLTEERNTGQLDETPNRVRLDMNTFQFKTWAKAGWVNPTRAGESWGFQFLSQVTDLNRQTNLTFQEYDARHLTYYANAIYQNYLVNPNHKIRLGGSYRYELYREFFFNQDFFRLESVGGLFAEYTFSQSDRFRLVAGIRGDSHNLWDLFFTPRLHMLFRPDDKTAIRLSGGRGLRTSSIFMENFGSFVNNRNLVIRGERDLPAYDLPPEIAWNTGANISRDFKLRLRPAQIRAEYFYTYFETLIAVDRENARAVTFYPVENGGAFAHSLLVEGKVNINRRFDVKAAYKWQRTMIAYNRGLLIRPFLPEHRAFVNASYKTRSDWAFDGTFQFIGSQRIPSTEANPETLQLDEMSPAFVQLHAQVSKKLRDGFEVYLGGENLLNFRQDDPVLSTENPAFFDASLIWGPVFGNMFYVGFRWTVK